MLDKFLNEDKLINWKIIGTYFCLYEAPKTLQIDQETDKIVDFKLDAYIENLLKQSFDG